MKAVTSAIVYRAYQAIFRYAEDSYTKHSHFQDKQKYHIGMNIPG